MENKPTLQNGAQGLAQPQFIEIRASHSIEASIIIPSFNRATLLEDALASLLALDSPYDAYEIIVVDNGSTDNTKGLVDAAITSHPSHRLRYFYEPIPGLLAGRHRGALEAKGATLVFVDDDIEADPGWLAAIMDTFKDPDVHLVGGRNLPKYGSNPPDWLESFWNRNDHHNVCGYLSLLDLGDKAMEIDPGYVWGLNFSIRKTTLFELGGFHPDCIPKYLQRFQGDGESGLTTKAKVKGLKAVYEPKALVYHHVPSERLSIEYFEQRMFYQGVCDSYTQIRRENLEFHATAPQYTVEYYKPLRIIRRMAGNLYRRLRFDPYRDVKKRVQAAYLEGFAFHQNEVQNDLELLKWVVKENYWDYGLPGISSSDRPVKGQSNAGN